jgi:predicted TIM-barrel enzyme
LAWAFSPDEARISVQSGAQVIGAMLGPSPRDAAGLEEALSAADAIAEAALSINSNVIVLGHGGPLTAPDAVRSFLMRSRCHGYASGSSIEGEPVIEAVAETLRDFAQRLRRNG